MVARQWFGFKLTKPSLPDQLQGNTEPFNRRKNTLPVGVNTHAFHLKAYALALALD